MAEINVLSISSKLKDYANSTVGKNEMKDTLRAYRDTGVGKTNAGSSVPTVNDMHAIALDLIRQLKIMARQLETGGVFPQSVADHFDSLSVLSIEERPDGSYVAYIAFDDDLSRDSLLCVGSNQSGSGYDAWVDRTGSGVDNIVALFDNGYSAKQVFGFWENAGIFTPSRASRPHLGFMQAELDDFKIKYGNIVKEAELMWVY